ncbi:MAG: 4-hydroxy-3-methylbut-2-enyl diphosphate reductase [Kosmotogaceae bacterium]
MKVISGKEIGFCYGVEKAISKVEELLSEGKKLAIEGELIHNDEVISNLEKRGLKKLDEVSPEKREEYHALIRTHGISPDIEKTIRERFANVVDLTCPIVYNVFRLAEKLEKQGNCIIIFGKKEHAETKALKGRLEKYIIIEPNWNSDSIKKKILEKDCKKYSLISQTTMDLDQFESLSEELRKFVEVDVHNTICSVTINREKEARYLAKKCDCVIVVGGEKSSNTKKLVELVRRNGTKAYHISCPNKLPPLATSETIGIISGTSTPAEQIQRLLDNIKNKYKEEVIQMPDERQNQEEKMSMEDVMEQMNDFSFRKGTYTQAEVYSTQPDGILVLLNGKLDGFIKEEELVNPIDEYRVGDKIDVTVMKINEDEGRTLASEKRAYFRTVLRDIEEAYKNGTPVKGEIIGEIKSGYLVRLKKAINAFLPGSHSGLKKGEKYPEKPLEFKILEFKKRNRGRNNIVVSLTELKNERIQKYFSELEEGQVVEGTVEAIKNFGAFVKLTEDITGLIPASEVSWASERIDDVINKNDKVKVKIIDINPKEQKVTLSLKRMTEDPWENIEEKYPVDTVVKGEVKSIVPFGFFVMLEPGVEGLVHTSEVFWGNVKKSLHDVVSVGDKVEVKVKEVNPEERTIALSYREAVGDPWENIEKKYIVNDIVEGKIVKVLPTGVIMEIEEYVSGFVPVSEISWNFVDEVEDAVSEGEKKKAMIISLDKENRRMRLSLKKATEDPWNRVKKELDVGDHVRGKIVRLTKSGAIVIIDDYNVEGFLPVSQVSTERVENIEDAVKIGEEKDFKIIRLVYDPENDVRNMVISIRQYLKDKERQEARETLKEINENKDENKPASIGEKIKEKLEQEGEDNK